MIDTSNPLTCGAAMPDIPALLCCPACRGRIAEDCCLNCGRKYERQGAQWVFDSALADTADACFQQATFCGTSLTGRMFILGKRLISSEYQYRDHLRHFLAGASPSAMIVELGSGARRLGPNVVNVDLFSFPNVDIVADIAHTPLRDNIADQVILDSVIEHVPDPAAVIQEAHRILKPAGRLFINCPFMLPYHGYPAHFQNFTRDGLQHQLRSFSECSILTTFGPMTSWVNMTAETAAVILGGERGPRYVIIKGITMLPIFWLKYLDFFFSRMNRSHRIAGMLSAVAVR